jgi:hypothetical protein
MGETLDELLQNAQEALRMWAEDALAEEEPLPAPQSLDEIVRDPQAAEALRRGAAFAIVPLLIESGRFVKAKLSMDAWLLAAIDDAAAARLTRRPSCQAPQGKKFQRWAEAHKRSSLDLFVLLIRTHINIDDGNRPIPAQARLRLPPWRPTRLRVLSGARAECYCSVSLRPKIRVARNQLCYTLLQIEGKENATHHAQARG